jgi:hypothetical protein
MAGNGESNHYHPARDGRALASHGISGLVVLEIAELGRPSADR